MTSVPAVQHPSSTDGGQPPPAAGVSLGRADVLSIAVNIVFWGAALLYVVVFCAISIGEYHAYLSHALDLGNMAQTFYNTVHGHPFRFQNMRAPIAVEAFGTSTRLSFHVEPIIPFLSIVYWPWQHVETLLVFQTVAVGSGVIPVRLLARKNLGEGIPELVFPVAYLLFPALEASNLYEFHPVTFAAPLLLWCFFLADERRYSWFALCAIAAMGCKEELGILVACIGFWIAIRKGDRQFGVIVAALSLMWSFTALFEVVPHFQGNRPSSYWARYLPPGWPDTRYPVGQTQVESFWLHHLGMVFSDLTSEAKLSYLHRILMPVGYTAFLSPLTLVIAVPSLALILLSYEPHMYGGLAHYSTEIVPVMIVSSILGIAWLGNRVAPFLKVSPRVLFAAGSIYVLVLSLANHRVNGLSPLAASFENPVITQHDRLADQAVALIPANSSVSAQDVLNPHVSDRAYTFLFPDTDNGTVDYILLDATATTGSTMRACDLSAIVTGDGRSCRLVAGPGVAATTSRSNTINARALLPSKKWNIAFARDGVLLLKKRAPGELLDNVLPDSFYSFARPTASMMPPNPVKARFGDYLELDGYGVSRREYPNLRNPDIVLTTWWRVLKTPPVGARLMHYLTDNTGALRVFSDDQQTTDWLPLTSWKSGETYEVQSSPLTVTTNHGGSIDVDLGLSTSGNYQFVSNNIPVTVISGGPPTAPVGPPFHGTHPILRVTSIHAQL